MADKLPSLVRKAYEKYEPEGKTWLLTQFLMVLLHARKCWGRIRQAEAKQLTPIQISRLISNCDLPKCKDYRKLLSHMEECEEGDQCKVQKCVFARQCLTHFDQCIDENCAFCLPIRESVGGKETTYPIPNNRKWAAEIPRDVREGFVNKLMNILLNLDFPGYTPEPVPEELVKAVINDLSDAERGYYNQCRTKKEYLYFCTIHYFKIRLMRNRAFSHFLQKEANGMHKRTIAARHDMLRVWYLIDGHKDSHWFRVPVPDDPIAAPHYYDIVTNPMDLTTVRQKIDDGKYECLRAFFEDIWLIFENARHYNTDESDVHIATFEMLKHLAPLADKMLTNAGHCCGEYRTYPPSIIICHSAKNCAIKPREYYWFYDRLTYDEVTHKPVTRRYKFCDNCYTHAKTSKDGMLIAASELAMEPGKEPLRIEYTKFIMINNVRPRREPMVQCLSCNRLSHKICVSFVDALYPGGFLCPSCTRKITTFDFSVTQLALRLPESNLSKHIENRVNEFLDKELAENQKVTFAEGRIAVRMLCNSLHEVEVKPRIRTQYPSLPERIPYRSKAIFAFQMVNGQEICFFGMHVQEYGDVPGPNRFRVYISYLDSVHYFEPRNLRTRVYYMIILSYLENCRDRGFRWAHIWACPPSTGDDYIFNVHPPEQKMPKTKQLQDWYQKMANFGIERNMIVEYKHLSEYVVQHNIRTLSSMPYFDGDFWVNHMEEIIEECEKKEVRQQQQLARDLERLEKQSTPVADLFPIVNPESPYRKSSKSRPASSASCAKRRCLSTRQQSLQEIIEEKFLAAVKKNRDNFFCFTLIPEDEPNKMVHVESFMDMDPLLPSELMDGRDAFLAKCRDNTWVFSTLRHAAYSTLQMCYHLMNQAPMTVHYTCNSCGGAPAWHCLECDDFDVCNNCPRTHQHQLEMLATVYNLEECATERRKRDHFHHMGRALQHTVRCSNKNCDYPYCPTAKGIIHHWLSCQLCPRDCNSCSTIVAKPLLTHVKCCRSEECDVPDCRRRRLGIVTPKLQMLEGKDAPSPPTRQLRQLPHRALKRLMPSSDYDLPSSPRTLRMLPHRVTSLPAQTLQQGRFGQQSMDSMPPLSRQMSSPSNASLPTYLPNSGQPSMVNWTELPGPSSSASASSARGYYRSRSPTARFLQRPVRRNGDVEQHYPAQFSQSAHLMPSTPRLQEYYHQSSTTSRSAVSVANIRAIRGRMMMRAPTPQTAQFMPRLPEAPRLPRYYLRQQPQYQDAPTYSMTPNNQSYQLLRPPPVKRRRTVAPMDSPSPAMGTLPYGILKTVPHNNVRYVILQPKNGGPWRPHVFGLRRTPSPVLEDPPVLRPFNTDIDSPEKSQNLVGSQADYSRRNKKQTVTVTS